MQSKMAFSQLMPCTTAAEKELAWQHVYAHPNLLSLQDRSGAGGAGKQDLVRHHPFRCELFHLGGAKDHGRCIRPSHLAYGGSESNTGAASDLNARKRAQQWLSRWFPNILEWANLGHPPCDLDQLDRVCDWLLQFPTNEEATAELTKSVGANVVIDGATMFAHALYLAKDSSSVARRVRGLLDHASNVASQTEERQRAMDEWILKRAAAIQRKRNQQAAAASSSSSSAAAAGPAVPPKPN